MEGMLTKVLIEATFSMRRLFREEVVLGSSAMLKCLKFRLLPFLYGLFDI